MAVVDAIPYRSRERFSQPWLRFVARTALALLALWVLHLAQNRYVVFQREYSSTFHLNGWLWLAWIGTSAAAGLLFGLAALLPFSRVSYLWSRLMLAAIASLPLAQWWLILGYLLPRRHQMSGWFVRTSSWVDDPGTQLALAVLVGVAIASGFRANDKGREPGRNRQAPAAFDSGT